MLALLSALAIGGADFVGGRLAARTSATAVVMVAGTVDLVLLGILAAATGADPSAADLRWGAIAGIVGALAFVIFLTAMARGPMSIVSPFTALFGVATPLTAGVLAGERPSLLAWIGCASGVAAVVLCSARRGNVAAPTHAGLRTLVLAAVSGIGFGGFVILLEQTAPPSGVAPIVIARAVGCTLLLLLSLTRRQPVLPAVGARLGSLRMGLLQAIATGALISALHAGALTLVGVLSSLYPISTLLLARSLLGERLDRSHQIGVVLALCSVALIAAG